MSFYQKIADYYHHIFKININQIRFVKSKLTDQDSKIIDIGCGIGTLSLELSNYYKHVLGIDMDSGMIQKALQQKDPNSKSIQFEQLSMLKINKFIDSNSIGGVICFGNTLVHLNSLEEIAEFLKQSKDVLQFNGKLLLQIVNYDRILANTIQELPLIENDDIIFERNYFYRKSEHKIDFKTILTVKSTQEIIENSIELVPLLKNDLVQLLKDAGFKTCNYYGNFNQDLYSINSPALIVEAW
ncbi:class I SAM-dependent methyltransferase [Formosa undariae]|uniref:Class I SAM-dependent methyltransferase n=1 Tax=Formosa undariae TaxID=1325436 RepID=A0ABV5EYA5_9FLAO